jgi:hypothetical protein
MSLRNVGVFWGHRSDALYQGLTLVGPLRPNRDLGFQPLRFFLCHVSVAARVLLGLYRRVLL